MPIKVTNYDKMTNITGIDTKKTNDEAKMFASQYCLSVI